jgi:hypothetical protein
MQLKISPNVGDQIVSGNITWQWNGFAWDKLKPDVTRVGVETLKNKTIVNPTAGAQVLQDASTIVWDCDLGQVAEVTLNGNRSIAAPLNLKPGAMLVLFVKQDSIGNRGLTFGTGYNISETYTLSTTQNAVDVFVFWADRTASKVLGGMRYKGQPISAPPPPATSPPPSPTPPPPPPPATPPPPAASTLAFGPNLSGGEWANASGNRHREWQSSRPNIHFSFPRAQDIAVLAASGLKKSRLCISWEMLQPIRSSSNASATVRNAYGVATNGAFYEVYAQYIDKVLDAHATYGIKCIIDLHNYGRYRDFIYDGSGNVAGFVNPADELVQPYTTDPSQVRTCIMSKAVGATLTVSDFTDFWTRCANRWKNHAGFGGYGLMNEVHDMPAVGGTVETTNGSEDFSIWTHFATQAYNAIRAVDPTGTVYVGGNSWSSAMSFGTSNPGFPIAGATNVIYECHLYLDAASNGNNFDWDIEFNKGFSAGEPAGTRISVDTGWKRLKYAVDWAAANGGQKLCLGEVGMPLHHDNWNECFKRLIDYAVSNNVEVLTWMGGNFWAGQSYPVNMTNEWYQNKTCNALVTGQLQRGLGINQATIFDAGPGYATSGAITIEVFARGNLTSPVTLTMASSNGGTFSPTSVTLPANVANPRVTYTFTPGANRVTTISYSGAAQVPPARKVYSLTDPVGYASTSLSDAAAAIIAKYSACKWEAADAYDGYLGSGAAAAANGGVVRAIGDSGYGSSMNNIMDMRIFHNYDTNMGWFVDTRLGVDTAGRKYVDFNQYGRRGLWAKKRRVDENGAGSHPNPQSIVPYWLHEPHFTIATIRIPTTTSMTGTVCAASVAESTVTEEINLSNGVPNVVIRGAAGQSLNLQGSTPLGTNTPIALTLTNVPGTQALRVNGTQVASGAVNFNSAQFGQLFFGGNFSNFWPGDPFPGGMYSLITGKGNITSAELAVLENYALSAAGSGAAPAPTPTPPAPPPSGQTAEQLAVAAITAAGAGALWDIGTNSTLHANSDGTGTVSPGGQIGRVDDRSGHGNHMLWPVNTNRMNYNVAGGLASGSFWIAPNTFNALGGSTSGFLFQIALNLGGGYYNVFFSDVGATANSGLKLEFDGDYGQIFFKAGKGTGYITVSQAFTPGVACVVSAWHDSSDIHLEVNNGPVASATVGNITAGGGLVFGSNGDGSRPMYSDFYGAALVKNSALTLADRRNIMTFLGSRAGLSL